MDVDVLVQHIIKYDKFNNSKITELYRGVP